MNAEGKNAYYLDELISRYPILNKCKKEIYSVYLALRETYINGGKLLIAGNGGSAADAEHITGELMKSFASKRAISQELKTKLLDIDENIGTKLGNEIEGALPAIPLTTHEALFTAYINDSEPVNIYAQQLYGYGKSGDMFLGISTSGNSENIIRAAVLAKAMDIKVVSLTGKNGGRLSSIEDIGIHVPEEETYKIQELHLPIYHCLCRMIEEYFFGGEI